ncbi:MAG: hypothetical protein UU31_C0001G0038 [Candidatus Uhrbacteria bacterium GW2011_GWA2_41_10]|uniref:Nudix hydrolase domain-containing protein n=1 Tax=Candidatus Uhrbacteria bacterium GW2011_GWC2_41_11 TaxID=1618985 RepID=A0A0G0WS29_9BACT|nr:MAG: hypothetical protein UU31_C0001G0038 [Candidatus Uhrbacteria bacterium GW2011_GWA2_41_10]KKR87265.1 MAG: hypothetical protein UU35_C0004G0038 [Candidatus Uhrbacteria bacterium GW2011_GWC2_41_11]HBO99851.1 hypothetical protein [Candidatus Uhrbacteria bacterium]
MPSIETGKLISSAIIIRDDRALVFEEKNDVGELKYNLPGGHIEPGETPIDALLREVLEETGMVCEPMSFLQLVVNTWDRNHSVLMYFSVRVAADAVVVLEEGITAQWMTNEDIAELPDDRCVFGIKSALAMVLRNEVLPSTALLLRKGGKQFEWQK